jgi:uncharacterized protein Yka (UPF0111/DUF47 family)
MTVDMREIERLEQEIATLETWLGELRRELMKKQFEMSLRLPIGEAAQ